MKAILMIYLILILGCSNIPKKAWKEIDSKEKILNLEIGDIILKEKKLNFLGIFGHVGVMQTNRLVVDYPKFGKKINIVDIDYWLEKDRKFIVLRYIGMNKKFKEKFLQNLNKYMELNLPYKIHFNIKRENGFYCSQFIWYIYYKTAMELGITLDSDNYFLFFPYDFVFSKNFYIVF
ncbi:YiiX/YebB-like N1pC/P60 family cysteine hydrolase [Fusobacterium sp. SYSU M8D902]|uniref:YiiX/YebB-like N1pC/P60 family cysteine hydrolase n=1 Tax=Fusobacterium sp. SYSU M8D902 TaxID=3159562 RepID=UPI0032E4BFB9